MKLWQRIVLIASLILLLIMPVVVVWGWGNIWGDWWARVRGVDKRIEFSLEVYNLIKNEYWEKISDEQLAEMYRLVLAKMTSDGQNVEGVNLPTDEVGEKVIKRWIQKSVKGMDEEEANQLVTRVADMVLANLAPFGRSRLYTQRLEQELANTVNNIDPTSNQYERLGVIKEASEKEIARAFETKKEVLEASDSAEAKKELVQVERAYDSLRDKQARELYDRTKIESTMRYELLTPRIMYLAIKKFSPTTVAELKRVTEAVDEGDELDSLILDLRGNIGGAIDGLPYFLGPFVGPNTLAYQYYRRGETEDYYTKTGWLASLVRYKKVVVLVDGQTQSSAEVMAAVLKKFKVGVLVGVPTKGWGTIERVFPLEHQLSEKERYSVFLVHRVTLRDDDQPIEGRGVEPDILITEAKWEERMKESYNTEMMREVKKLIEEK